MTDARNDQDIAFAILQKIPPAAVDQDAVFIVIQKAIPAAIDQEVLFVVISHASFPFPILPIQVAGQNTNKPAQPIRSPAWNVKNTNTWSSIKQQTTSGKVFVIKRQQTRTSGWEFTFEVLIDNPLNPNGFYTVPVPATDMEILEGFFNAAKAGTKFAYQPPDTIRGGTYTVTGVSVLTSNLATIFVDGNTSVSRLRLGDSVAFSGFVAATYLNGATGIVNRIDPNTNSFTISATISGTHAFISDTGTMLGGQLLPATDANNRTMLVNTIGSFPTTPTSSYVSSLVTDPVQLVDAETVFIYSNGTPISCSFKNITKQGRGMYTASPPNVAPYQGIVLEFPSPPATPLMAMFHYYYICRFSEDTQEYDNFMTMLWACSSVKIEQIKQ